MVEFNKEEQITFSDIYVEQVLYEIKNIFLKKINVNNNEDTLNMCENPFERVERKMRKVLKDILYPQRAEKDSLSESVFDNNFLALQGTDTTTARKTLRCSLILYYTALYFDNVELLFNLILAGVDFGKNPDELMLCLLDREVSDLFDSSKYAEIIKRAYGFFEPCYDSVSTELYGKRKAHLSKFARIIEKRKDLSYRKTDKRGSSSVICSRRERNYGEDEKIFTCYKLDIFDEETYMKASLDQLRTVVANVGKFSETKNISRLKNLVLNEGYCNNSVFLGEALFDFFSDEELINLEYDVAKFFVEIYPFYDDIVLGRVKNLCMRRPNLVNYDILINKVFLDLFSDEDIHNLPNSVLEDFSNYTLHYFPRDILLLDSSYVNRIRECIEEQCVNVNAISFFKDKKSNEQCIEMNEGDVNEIAVINDKMGIKQQVKLFLGMR